MAGFVLGLERDNYLAELRWNKESWWCRGQTKPPLFISAVGPTGFRSLAWPCGNELTSMILGL